MMDTVAIMFALDEYIGNSVVIGRTPWQGHLPR